MILIKVADSAVLLAIEEKKPGWLLRAGKKRAAALKAGRVAAKDGIWSEIKEVFILLQDFKCIYCETPMAKTESRSANKVAVDYDVEHYRPKNRVTPWPTQEILQRRPQIQAYQARVIAGWSDGYLRLAFDPFNYVVSCKACNSSYKCDHFPIAGTPDATTSERVLLDTQEQPLLLFPFGERGDDPDEYLQFRGPLVGLQVGQHPGERLRAQVVIDFFELDTREDLLESRCHLILMLWPQLESKSSLDPIERRSAEDFLNVVHEERRFPHTACGRSFIGLYDRDPAAAKHWYNAARAYLTSKEPSVFKAVG
jgi:hypothetical protein